MKQSNGDQQCGIDGVGDAEGNLHVISALHLCLALLGLLGLGICIVLPLQHEWEFDLLRAFLDLHGDTLFALRIKRR